MDAKRWSLLIDMSKKASLDVHVTSNSLMEFNSSLDEAFSPNEKQIFPQAIRLINARERIKGVLPVSVEGPGVCSARHVVSVYFECARSPISAGLRPGKNRPTASRTDPSNPAADCLSRRSSQPFVLSADEWGRVERHFVLVRWSNASNCQVRSFHPAVGETISSVPKH